MSDTPDISARLLMRERPDTRPLMYQSWGKLLFIHWRISVAALRPFIPERLTIDTFDDTAWMAITPFTLWGLRPVFLPAIPGISNFHEINCRTYVDLDDQPGVWFFSLDANSWLNTVAARLFYCLPYYYANIHLDQHGNTIDYRVKRTADKPASFRGTWTIGEDMPESDPGTLEFFLTERYCLYTEHKAEIFRCRIHHRPWPLQRASLHDHETDLFAGNGLPLPTGSPVVFAGGPVDVEVWPLERVV